MAVISEALQLCKIHKRQFLLLQVTQEFISGTTSRTCCVSMCNDVHRMNRSTKMQEGNWHILVWAMYTWSKILHTIPLHIPYKYRIAENVWERKLSEIQFSWRKTFAVCAANGRSHVPNFAENTFVNSHKHKISKFMKVFSLKVFRYMVPHISLSYTACDSEIVEMINTIHSCTTPYIASVNPDLSYLTIKERKGLKKQPFLIIVKET